MKKLIVSVLAFSSLQAFAQADLQEIQKKQVFTATSKNLKHRFDAKVLCSEKDMKIACYAFHFKSWEEITNPKLAYVAGYGSEPDAILSKISAKAECKKIRGLSKEQTIIQANGDKYIEFRAGAFERAKVLRLVRGDTYIDSLECDLTKLYETQSN